MNKRSKLILLDADIVLYLHEIKLWDCVCDNYDVYLSQTVAEEECLYDPNLKNDIMGQKIDIEAYKRDGKISVISVDATDLGSMQNVLKSYQAPAIDPGESESLARIFNDPECELKLCIADKAAIMCSVFLQVHDRCISLEEVLASIGIKRKLYKQFTIDWFRRYTDRASADKIMRDGN